MLSIRGPQGTACGGGSDLQVNSGENKPMGLAPRGGNFSKTSAPSNATVGRDHRTPVS